jgi:hypothetical protein
MGAFKNEQTKVDVPHYIVAGRTVYKAPEQSIKFAETPGHNVNPIRTS